MSTTHHPEFASEQDFLRHAVACLEAMRDGILDAPNAGGDAKAMAALARYRDRVIDHLENPDTIVFGRINFESGESFHVGPRGVVDDSRSTIVVSWAAPAAKPFYEASPTAPDGLSLRRRLQTDRAVLLGIADEWFGTGAPEPTLDDLLLDELSRERTAEMRQVAATIQSDQYRIIERPFDQPTIVQGGPGTGKTIVGLHRAALLLYRHRQELASRRVLVVGPNRVFMRYIAYVLPSLGETAVDQVVVDDLGSLRVSRQDDHLVARVKGDGRMTEVLRRAVVDRVRPPLEPLRFEPTEGVPFAIATDVVKELIGDYDGLGASYNDARDRFREGLERAVLSEYAAEHRRLRPGVPPSPLVVTDLPEYNRASDRIWPTFTGAEFVRQLLSSEERIERAAAGVLTDVERRLLYRKPVNRLDEVEWTPSDIPLVDVVQQYLDPASSKYGHVILDEAQDLTPMQLRMVGRRVLGGSITVLGDLAQATGLWSYATWEEVAAELGFDAVDPDELTHAYRVPREIMETALPVLALTAPSISPPVPFRDGGSPPGFVPTERDRRIPSAIETALAAYESGGTAALIVPTSLLETARAELVRSGIEFGDAEQGELVTSVELLDPRSSKGLEFDHVVLVEPAAIIREAEGQGQRDLYVALTRATRTLTCIHAEPLPWPLGDESIPVPGARAMEDSATETDVDRADDESATADVDSGGEHDVVPEGGGDPAPTPSLSVAEALAVVRMRDWSETDALARALVARARGGSDTDIAHAILDPSTVDAEVVAAVIASARDSTS